ncbi:MAG: hypothetical protein K9H41_03295 [Bacteroidia bacterium]|nr:hypothetical protein [Bacteroidia bacterium]
METYDKLKPMSRLKFQILYNSCSQSGWVDGEFSETMYLKYLLRYAYFLDYLQNLYYVLNRTKLELPFFIDEGNQIVFLIDDSDLLHPVYLKNRIKIQNQEINSEKNTKKGRLCSLCIYKGLLIDLFPFPIKRVTKIRKTIVEDGYTFREHLVNYFVPFITNIRNYLGEKHKKVIYFLAESPNEDNESTYLYNPNGKTSPYLTFPEEKSSTNAEGKVFIICPPYVGIHAYLEFEYGLNNTKGLFKFQDDSNYTFQSHEEANDFIDNYFDYNARDISKKKDLIGFNEKLKECLEAMNDIAIDDSLKTSIADKVVNLFNEINLVKPKSKDIQQYLWLNTNIPGQKK